MSSSAFCIEQRQLEIQQTRKWLACGLMGSIAVHSGLAVVVSNWKNKPTVTEEPIELIIIEEPKPEVPAKARTVQPIPPPPSIKPLPKTVPLQTTMRQPLPQQKIIQPSQPLPQEISPPPKISAIIPPKTLSAITPPPKIEAKVTPIEPPVTPPIAPPENIAPLEPLTQIKPIAPVPDHKPVITAPSPTLPMAVKPEAIATSTPPLVNRTTGVIKPSNSQSREQLKNSFGNQSASLPTSEVSPNAIATSTPPLVNRTTGVIKNNQSPNRDVLKTNLDNQSPTAQISESNLEAIASSAPPLVNRTTGVIKNNQSPNREQLKNSFGNQSASLPTSEVSPNAIARSAPPLVNRSTGAIKPSNSQSREQLKAGLSNISTPSKTTNNSTPSTPVATRQGVPSRPSPKPTPSPLNNEREDIICISNCQPSYPSALNGIEGRAGVRVTIDTQGNVTSATLVNSHSNSNINREALLAARKMKFTNPPDSKSASVQVSVNFVVAGSEFDSQARERREQQEKTRLAREKKKKENQARLEQERQERQRQLQQEQKERQAQLEKERQERQRRLQLEKQTPPPLPANESTESTEPIEKLDTNLEIKEQP
ncbi:MAG: TonB family protein [Snowella sp.]|nr:TonB family protein [Snowella sp.]